MFTPPSVGRSGNQGLHPLNRLTGEFRVTASCWRLILLFYISNGEWSLVAASSRPGHHLLHKVLYNNAWCEESVSQRRQGGVRGETRVSKLVSSSIPAASDSPDTCLKEHLDTWSLPAPSERDTCLTGHLRHRRHLPTPSGESSTCLHLLGSRVLACTTWDDTCNTWT